MQFLLQYFKQHRKSIVVFFLFCLIFISIFAMYQLPLEAVLYPILLCLILGIFILGFDYQNAYKKHCKLIEIQKAGAELMHNFPTVQTIDDADYQEIIHLHHSEQADITTQMSTRYSDMIDYYTVWAHQIKTPIASIRLNLQNEDTEFARKVSEDLQRIEQYVEMVLAFLRLDSSSTDYVIKEQNLDAIVKSAIKKFSTQFIRRKISLSYEPLNAKVITDEKWLSFVVEQVISNSLKYTKTGTISIFMEEPKTLCIRDTGIGIASEDLPRIFEKGYTGYNGRNDKKASGIGLYLCKRICSNLGHTITADSVLDAGTIIRINLEQNELGIE